MAQLKILENAWDAYDLGTVVVEKPQKVTDEFYNALIGKIDEASARAEKPDVEPLTEDTEVEELLKDTIEDAFSTGTVDFTDSYKLLDEDDKVQFEALVTQFLEAINAEKNGGEGMGFVQELLNRLFPDENISYTDPYQAIRDELAFLQKKEDITAEEITKIIVPMLVDASLNSSITKVSPLNGNVMLGNNEISIDDFEHAMEELAAMIAEVNAAQENPLPVETLPGENGAIGEIEGTGEGTEVPVNPEVPEEIIPEVPEEPVEEIPPTEDVTDPTTETEEVAEIPTEEPTDTTPVPTESTDLPTEQTIPEEVIPPQAEVIENVSFEGDGADLFTQGSLTRASTRIQQPTSEFDEISVASAMTNAPVAQTITEVPVIPAETANHVQSQIVEFISGQMTSVQSNTTSEMTMVLNPENLGQLTVQVSSNNGEIVIRIAAQSEETQALLRDRLPQLMQSLSDVNGSLREIQVVEPQNMAGMNLNLSGSGAQQQQASQNAYAEQSTQSEQTVETVSEEEIMKGANRLWQTA